LKTKRHRKLLTSAALGVWVLALLVGIANACGWADAFTHSAAAGVAHNAAPQDDNRPFSDCVKLCAEGLPVLAKVQAVQDPPEGQPLVVDPGHGVDLWPSSAPALRRLRVAYPPPAAPPLLRFLRLTL
jgi:hypothetical protein